MNLFYLEEAGAAELVNSDWVLGWYLIRVTRLRVNWLITEEHSSLNVRKASHCCIICSRTKRKIPLLYFWISHYGEFWGFYSSAAKRGSENRLNIYPGQRQQTQWPSTFRRVIAEEQMINPAQAETPGSTRCSVIRPRPEQQHKVGVGGLRAKINTDSHGRLSAEYLPFLKIT